MAVGGKRSDNDIFDNPRPATVAVAGRRKAPLPSLSQSAFVNKQAVNTIRDIRRLLASQQSLQDHRAAAMKAVAGTGAPHAPTMPKPAPKPPVAQETTATAPPSDSRPPSGAVRVPPVPTATTTTTATTTATTVAKPRVKVVPPKPNKFCPAFPNGVERESLFPTEEAERAFLRNKAAPWEKASGWSQFDQKDFQAKPWMPDLAASDEKRHDALHTFFRQQIYFGRPTETVDFRGKIIPIRSRVKC